MASTRDHPGVIAPPPLLYAGTLMVGLAVDFLLVRVPTGLPPMARYGPAVMLGAGAAALAAGAIGRFLRAGTHVEPWRPATVLVTDGVYRFTRNPMYVAMTLLYGAVALAADSVVTLVLLLPLLVVMRHGVIAREERYLDAKFGDGYRQYRGRVRRWL